MLGGKVAATAGADDAGGAVARGGAPGAAGPPRPAGADRGVATKAMGVADFLDKGLGGAKLPRKKQDRAEKEKQKRAKGQSTHAEWKSEAFMVLRWVARLGEGGRPGEWARGPGACSKRFALATRQLSLEARLVSRSKRLRLLGDPHTRPGAPAARRSSTGKATTERGPGLAPPGSQDSARLATPAGPRPHVT
jgi:hypothetical protein